MGAVDAFFAPVAFRVRTYGIDLPPPARAYVERLLAHPAMQKWEAAAMAETWRDDDHEAELADVGTITQDLRAHP
jgi:glutathione S-transferase